MPNVGFINPNIFAQRHLEYRIRFSRAPLLTETIKQLEKEQNLNSYLVRGDYDIVLVSVESNHYLFKALFERRTEELKLQGTAVFTVNQFLKYHGCVVTPIGGAGDSLFYSTELLHYLFDLSKDWDSGSEIHKNKLVEMNLLMFNTLGLPYEEEAWESGEGQVYKRRTIIRLGFDGVISDIMYSDLKEYIETEIVNNPVVRNCYSLKSPVPYLYVLEAVGCPGAVDDFLIHLHEECDTKFHSLRLFARCDDVMKKLSDGHFNILLTMQTKPELLALAEEKLIAPIFYAETGEQTKVVHFIEKCEAGIRHIRAEELRKGCIEMLSELQVALQLNSHSMLREAVNQIALKLVTFMIQKLAFLFHCDPTEEAIIGELKRRGMFREHTATLGNLYPVFIKVFRLFGGADSAGTDSERVFEKFNEYRNSFIISKGTELLTEEEKDVVEQLFPELITILPRYFDEAAKAG